MCAIGVRTIKKVKVNIIRTFCNKNIKKQDFGRGLACTVYGWAEFSYMAILIMGLGAMPYLLSMKSLRTLQWGVPSTNQ